MRTYVWTYSIVCACVGVTISCANARARSTAERDAESYAIATCLSNQQVPYLKDQADDWASNIVFSRDNLGIPQMNEIQRVVKTEITRRDMAMIMLESPRMTLKKLPVEFCGEIIDAPRVRAVIERVTATILHARKPVKAK